MTDMEEVLIEKSVDLMDTIHVMFTKQQFVGYTLACGAAGLGLGLAIGAYASKLYFDKKHAEELETRVAAEVEATKRIYNTLHKVDIEPEELAKKYPESSEQIYGAPQEIIDKAVEAVQHYNVTPEEEKGVPEDKEEAAELVQSIFPPRPNEPDFSVEVSRRNTDYPYIISQDEFYADEKDYEHNSLTYFNGDDTLLDDREMPIVETDEIVGDDNLTAFGQWSKDPNIVHVRNDRLRTDFEITRSMRNYGEEVGGFIKHSHDPGARRRFRRGEDE